MKRKTPFIIAFLAISTSLLGQSPRLLLKQNLLTEAPIKLDNMVWVNPVIEALGKTKEVPDTLKIDPPRATRFYFDPTVSKAYRDGLSTKELAKTGNWIRKASTIPSEMMYAPFYMKTAEVSNAEYRLFLNEATEVSRKKLLPDTACWTTDFPGSYNEPMVRVYFQHPRYDNYPVVGVSYFQAKEFCKWMEERINLANSSEKFRFVVSLPNQFEWAAANGDSYVFINSSGKQFIVCDSRFYDSDHLTDLILEFKNDSLTQLDRTMLRSYSNLNRSNFIDDGYMYTTPVTQKKSKWQPELDDENGRLRYLNTNVSEWCEESYVDNWKQLYDLRQELLRELGTEDAVLLADLEKHYNSRNDTLNGQLVRGGNWVYEQHAYRNGRNVGAHRAKIFIDPNSQHSTLGFRYVVRPVPKNKPQ